MRTLLHSIGSVVVGLVLIGAGTSLAGSAQPPNVVLFLSDDLGYGDLACYGHPYAKTPNLDQLAREGTRFTQHCATGVTCCPSRTGIMTGIHTARFPGYPAFHGYGDRKTVTDLLHARGYATGHFGKWHMGPEQDAKPGTYGIDVVDVKGKSKDAPGRDDDLVSDAIAFIEEHAEGPFYVNIWGHSTHNPVEDYPELAREMGDFTFSRADFAKTSDIQKKFDDSQALNPDLKDSMHQYLADVYSIDKNMGRVMATLNRLGIADNTIVVFSSDQGPDAVLLGSSRVRPYAAHLLGYAGDLRGGKHTRWEGGVRIPLIIRWPGHIQAGRVDDQSVTSFMDWLPTLCTIAGIKDLPKDLDGEDISDIWLKGPRERRTTLFWRTATNPKNGVALRDGHWKFFKEPDETLLFDLSKDESEQHNLAAKFPEVVRKLSAEVDAWSATLPKEYVNDKQAKKKNGGDDAE